MSGTFDCDQWLNMVVEIHNKYESVSTMPRHHRICWLVLANGGFDIHQWGIISNGGPNGHQCGLEQNDALELIDYRGFLNGLAAAGVPIFDKLKPYFDKYLAALQQADAANKPSGG